VASFRCIDCGINYPYTKQFEVCPIHEEPCQVKNIRDPDENWKEAFSMLLDVMQRSASLTSPIPYVSGVKVIEEDGLFFIDQQQLVRAGLILSRTQNDQFYLLRLADGWIYETQGFDDPRRRWWVERVMEGVLFPTATTPPVVPSSTEPATS
jgi:hypothetical protein